MSGELSTTREPAPAAGADACTIYVAVEISRSSWVVALHCPDAGGKVSVHALKPADTGSLVQLIDKARASSADETRVLLTYEAGYEGYWLARDLERRDASIGVFMNDPASLQTNRKARKAKTDRIDARKMVRALKAWDQGDADAMAWVRVPSVQEEDNKRLLRERDSLIKERIRLVNRVRGLLKLHGVFDLSPRKREFLNQLATLRTGYGAPLPPHLLEEIERAVERLRLVESQLAAIEATKRVQVKAGREALAARAEPTRAAPAMIANLNRIHGIGINDATLLATEVFYRDFRNRREVGSWAGLTSVPWASGGFDHDQGISKAGPSHVRKHLIQMAWRWVRLQPGSDLAMWFHQYVAEKGKKDKRRRKRGIVALARKLLIALWRYATQGLVPRGAIVA